MQLDALSPNTESAYILSCLDSKVRDQILEAHLNIGVSSQNHTISVFIANDYFHLMKIYTRDRPFMVVDE